MTVGELGNTKKGTIKMDKVPKVGRPRKYDKEGLLRRNITVTNVGWEGFEKIAKDQGLSSRSELFDQIGRGQRPIEPIQFIPTAEIPVLPRLLSLIRKTAYLKSLLSFTRLVSLKTGLIQELYDNEIMIKDTVTKAISIVALRSYVYPDDHTSSALADIRWIIFRLLISSASGGNSHTSFSLNDEDSHENIIREIYQECQSKFPDKKIRRIIDAIDFLAKNNAQEYQVYEMRMMESLTWEQIYRLLKLRDSGLTEEQIRQLSHKAVGIIREAWHGLELDEIEVKSQAHEKDKLFHEMGDSLKIAQLYYDIFANTSTKIESKDFKKWESFLLIAMHQDPKLDLLLPEIHHSWVHDMGKTNNLDMYEYNEKNNTIIDSIDNEFEKYLDEQLNILKKKLKFCGNKKQDVQETLMSFVNNDLAVRIPEGNFLGNRVAKN
jgi:hypothetical protein